MIREYLHSKGLAISNLNKVAMRSVQKPIHKAIKKAIKGGDIASANRLIDEGIRAGSIRRTAQGTQVRILGSGMEGTAVVTYGQTENKGRIAVRKLMDRYGEQTVGRTTRPILYDKKLLGEKFNVMRRERGNPNIARLYSKKLRRTGQGSPYYFSEYIPKGEPALTVPISKKLLRKGHSFGQPMMGKKVLMDVVNNPGNFKVVKGRGGAPATWKEKLLDKAGKGSRGDQAVVIDFLPTSKKNLRAVISGQGPSMTRLRKIRGEAAIEKTKLPEKLKGLGRFSLVKDVLAGIDAGKLAGRQASLATRLGLNSPKTGTKAGYLKQREAAASLSDQYGLGGKIAPSAFKNPNPFAFGAEQFIPQGVNQSRLLKTLSKKSRR